MALGDSHTQKVRLSLGDDGTDTTPVSSENPLPVVSAISRVAKKLLSNAIATGVGDAVESSAGPFSVVVSGMTSSGAGSATVVIEGSHDGVTPVTLATVTLTLGTVLASDGFAAAISYRYTRARLSAISGTGASVNATLGF